MSDQIFWFTTRSAGIMTWATAMASIAIGLLLASRVMGRKPGYPWLLDLHRFVSGLTLVFMVLHMATLWADDFVDFGPVELLVPGKSATQTDAVSWGVGAAWVLVVIQISSLLKDRLPKRVWRSIHLGAYLVAVMGTIHGWQAGSDVRNPVAVSVGVACWCMIGALTLTRVMSFRSRLTRRGLPNQSLR